MSLPSTFHLLAIVGDPRQLEYVVKVAAGIPDVSFGIMLRDGEHDPLHIKALGELALGMHRSDNITLISNSVVIDGVPLVHFTSTQLRRMMNAGQKRFASDRPFGISVHSRDEAIIAEEGGAVYVLLSPIFPTPSKPGHPGIGPDELQVICSSLSIPVVALGGINEGNVLTCLRSGAHGVAGISLFQPESQGELRRAIARVREFFALNKSHHNS